MAKGLVNDELVLPSESADNSLIDAIRHDNSISCLIRRSRSDYGPMSFIVIVH